MGGGDKEERRMIMAQMREEWWHGGKKDDERRMEYDDMEEIRIVTARSKRWWHGGKKDDDMGKRRMMTQKRGGWYLERRRMMIDRGKKNVDTEERRIMIQGRSGWWHRGESDDNRGKRRMMTWRMTEECKVRPCESHNASGWKIDCWRGLLK